MPEISLPAEDLLASQEDLFFMEYVKLAIER
jgi:hypothetical protein